MNSRSSSHKTLLYISNYLSKPKNYIGAAKEIGLRLSAHGWIVITTSNKSNKIIRLIDMTSTSFLMRHKYFAALIDVFSGPAFIWAFITGWIFSKLKKPFLLILRGGNLPEYSCCHQKPVTLILNQATTVVVPSRYLLEAMQPYRDDLILIPNALDVNLYSYKMRYSPKPILIWLRAFHNIYNPELAIRMLHLLKSDFPEIRLIMIGPDKGDGSLQDTQKLVRQFGLEDAVEFPGIVPKSEVSAWLNKGDVFINTTNIDNTPISVMEALACGLCIVSTNVGGLPYLIENDVDGLLVPPNDPAAMAAAVERILTEPGLAEKLSANARKKAEQFDWSMILPQWEKLISEIIKKEKE